MTESKSGAKPKVFTIPNILSFIRIGMIPVMIWLYCFEERFVLVGILLVLSALTDIVDGYIARHFNMVSDVGKLLDPIADKCTQGVMMICLILRFHLMVLPLCAMLCKEIFMLLRGYIMVKKGGKIFSAQWHGKAATVMLYGTMVLHTFWYNIPAPISTVMIIACTALILFSFVMYGLHIKKEIDRVN